MEGRPPCAGLPVLAPQPPSCFPFGAENDKGTCIHAHIGLQLNIAHLSRTGIHTDRPANVQIYKQNASIHVYILF